MNLCNQFKGAFKRKSNAYQMTDISKRPYRLVMKRKSGTVACRLATLRGGIKYANSDRARDRDFQKTGREMGGAIQGCKLHCRRIYFLELTPLCYYTIIGQTAVYLCHY